MIDYLLASLLTLIAVLVGYFIGKRVESSSVVDEQAKRFSDHAHKMSAIFKRSLVSKVDNKKPGPIERPTADQVFLRDHPEIANEQGIMKDVFTQLNSK